MNQSSSAFEIDEDGTQAPVRSLGTRLARLWRVVVNTSTSLAHGVQQNRKPNKPKKAQRYLIICIEAGLCVLLALTVARMIWSMAAPQVGGEIASIAPDRQSDSISESRESAVERFSILASYNPFARKAAREEVAAETQTEQAATREAAPETSLALKLMGVRTGSDGTAIVAMPNGKQDVFTPGEPMGDKVRLLEIFDDRIELDRKGNRESLYFQRNDKAEAAARRSMIQSMEEVSRRPMNATESALRQPKVANPAPVRGAQNGPEVSEKSDEEVDLADASAVNRKRIGIDGPSAIARLDLRPRILEGSVNGFFVLPRGDGGFFRELGLRGGDVLISVDGTRLTSISAAQRLRQELAGRDETVLELERGGDVLVWTVELDE
ncbi:MAG: type II secretion system protein N [Pseudomonadota bacterium]